MNGAEMKSWEELTELEQAACIFSDMYKDVHGVRPRFDDSSWTIEEYNRQMASLNEQMEIQIAEEKEREQEAISKFENLVAKTIEVGASNRETALRWIMSESEANGDWEYFCFLNNLPYGYFKKTEI